MKEVREHHEPSVGSPGSRAKLFSGIKGNTRRTTDNQTHSWTTDSRMHSIRAKYRIIVIIRGRRQNKGDESLKEHVTRGRRRSGRSVWNEWQLYFPRILEG